MEYTNDDIRLLYQSEKLVYIKIELAERDGTIINTLEGNLINDDLSVAADSNVRRTYNCTFHIDSDQWAIGADRNVWINKRIIPYVGYKSTIMPQLKWYKLGTFVMNAPNFQYDESTHTITLSCLDLMATLDGTLGGVIHGDGIGGRIHKVEYNTPIRDAIIAILVEAGITEYNVCQFNNVIPYDIEVNVGSTYKDFIDTIINLYAGYEYFFDEDGVFTVRLIPQLLNDFITLSYDVINPLVISESRTNDWSNVRNYIEVYGQNIEPKYYCEAAAATTTAWTASIATLDSYDNGDTYAIQVPASNTDYLTININNLGAKRVYDDDGLPLKANTLNANTVYCFRYRGISDNMLFLGQYQAYGVYEETSPDCPFSTTNLGYRIHGIVEDENIYSDSLCRQRAKYECYIASWMQDNISLTLVDIPFLDVNQKITYVPIGETEPMQFITRSIKHDTANGTMTLELTKFSEAYPNMAEVYENQFA